MVPACRSLDAMSIFVSTAEEASLVAANCRRPRSAGSLVASARPRARSRLVTARAFRFAVPLPAQREFMGNTEYARLFEVAITHLEKLGGEPVSVDISPLLECAQLLYQGPVGCRALPGDARLIESNPAALLPVTRDIIAAGARPSARDAFLAQYRLQELRRVAEVIWAQADLLLLPTAADALPHRRSGCRTHRAQHGPGPLHQLRQPHGPGGSGRPCRVHGARPALRRVADRACVDRCGPVASGVAHASNGEAPQTIIALPPMASWTWLSAART